MKSRITVEIDYENGNRPCIEIMYRKSDDVRDGLIQSFLHSLGGSPWCNINWVFTQDDPTLPQEMKFQRIRITAIPQEKVSNEVKLMQDYLSGRSTEH